MAKSFTRNKSPRPRAKLLRDKKIFQIKAFWAALYGRKIFLACGALNTHGKKTKLKSFSSKSRYEKSVWGPMVKFFAKTKKQAQKSREGPKIT